MAKEKIKTAVCKHCNEIFELPERKRGGTKRIYCSPSCATKAWAVKYPEKRKAIVKKCADKPESKTKKRLAQRKRRLSNNYGMTIDDFEVLLKRQNHRCFGCMINIDENTARVDHDHDTGKVRGLLCDHCNWVLGHARDNPRVLRRLMAYLDKDLDKKLIYLIGALKNEIRIPEIGNELRAEGYDVMDEWITPGEPADTNWQRYEKIRGRTYEKALRGRAATNIFLFDSAYIEMSDAVVMVAPCGKSGFIELGYARGLGKKTFILMEEEPERYDVMTNFADKICYSLDELKQELKKLK